MKRNFKKMAAIMAICVLCAMAFTSLTVKATGNVPETNTTSNVVSFPIPEALVGRVLSIALDNHCITEAQAEYIKKNDVAGKCLSDFIESDYDPAAVVDRLADESVNGGFSKSKAEAKSQMKNTIEKARKDENIWTTLYRLFGL